MFDEDDATASVARGLRMARGIARKSQADLCREVTVPDGEGGEKPFATQVTVSNWEKGLNSIPVPKLWALADYYGLSLDELAGRAASEG